MYEFTYFEFFQIPNKIPRKNKKQGAASTVPIGAKPYDPNEDDDDYEWVKAVHPSNKNNVGDKFCAGNVEKGSTDDGQSVAAASTEIYHKKYSPNVEDGFVSYFQCLYIFFTYTNSHILYEFSL